MVGPVTVSVQDNMVHFHVFGDERMYLDRISLELAHPEIADFMRENGFLLERELMQQREILNLDRGINL